MENDFPFGNRDTILCLEKRYWNQITPAEKCAEKCSIPAIVDRARKLDYLLKDDFFTLGRWKSRERNIHNYQKNSCASIQTISQKAFSAETREEALRHLDTLKGVALPTASAILHWFRDDTPIIDFRVIEALGYRNVSDSKKLNYAFYAEIAERVICNAKRANVSLREMDRALWAWHKLNTTEPRGTCA